MQMLRAPYILDIYLYKYINHVNTYIYVCMYVCGAY